VKRLVRVVAIATVCGSVFVPPAADAASRPPALAVLPGGVNGHHGHVAFAANETGDIVGAIEVDGGACCTGPHHAARWRGGVLFDLGTLGGVESEARGVDRLGRIVGWTLDPAGTSWAFVWAGGVMSPLWPGAAYDLNERGDIVGRLDTPAGSRPVLWRAGRLVELPGLGGDEGEARAITAAGDVVVGWSRDGAGVRTATRWRAGAVAGLWPGVAHDVNAAGTIVGAADCALVEQPCDAVVWRSGSLALVGGGAVAAYAVNDAGVVVGAPAYRLSSSALSWLPVLSDRGTAYDVTNRGDIVGAVGFIDRPAVWS
jgi:probable HAF family extracellular repeat protein